MMFSDLGLGLWVGKRNRFDLQSLEPLSELKPQFMVQSRHRHAADGQMLQ
jgi:hypothetical protein